MFPTLSILSALPLMKTSVDFPLMLICKDVSKQIGADKFLNILGSKEYKELTKANEETFILVDKARAEKEGLAKETDSANIHRYNAKVALQKKFFGTESKELKSVK